MNVVSRDDWLAERKKLLDEEKQFLKQRDALSARRRNMPWVKVEKSYSFDTPNGKKPLEALFDGNDQLIMYHFMFGDGWDEGCPSCSMWADGYDGLDVHLRARNSAFVTVSNAPLDQLQAYQKRMGWQFNWASSFGSDFNYDYAVSFTGEQQANDDIYYNYRKNSFPSKEAPGISVFVAKDGHVYHTYSCFSRGLDNMNPVYQYLDLLPEGRDEDKLDYPMAWVRRHDQYAS